MKCRAGICIQGGWFGTPFSGNVTLDRFLDFSELTAATWYGIIKLLVPWTMTNLYYFKHSLTNTILFFHEDQSSVLSFFSVSYFTYKTLLLSNSSLFGIIPNHLDGLCLLSHDINVLKVCNDSNIYLRTLQFVSLSFWISQLKNMNRICTVMPLLENYVYYLFLLLHLSMLVRWFGIIRVT